MNIEIILLKREVTKDLSDCALEAWFRAFDSPLLDPTRLLYFHRRLTKCDNHRK